jgi:K(+)-stimulated pyrophosphate-energized sodium pump
LGSYHYILTHIFTILQAAGAIIVEVRRQFNEIPGLRDGTAEADCDACVAISTKCSIQEMILPGLYAILSPITVGFLIGSRCLTGMLGGAIASGMMLAIMMANAGGAWDNSKKYIEIEGAHGGKGTEIHKACVVGDTVGDPFKDTSGPALNILIKLMSIISLTIAPLIKGDSDWENAKFGVIPLVIMLLGTYVVYFFFWRNTDAIAPASDSDQYDDADDGKKDNDEPPNEAENTVDKA